MGQKTLTQKQQYAIMGSLRAIDEFLMNVQNTNDPVLKAAAAQAEKKLAHHEKELQNVFVEWQKELFS